MSNLRLINETVGTSITTLSVTDVFTNDFDIYKLIINCETTLEQETDLRFINSSGSIVTASDYDYAQLYLRAYASDTEINSTSDTDIRLVVGDEDSFGGSAVIYVFNPTNSSSYTFVVHQGSLAIDLSDNDTVSFASNKGIGVLHQTSPIPGFHLKNNNSRTTTYTTKTYGLRVDS